MDPQSEDFRKDIEQFDLFFTMKDNKIINVIPDVGETTEALNIKRGKVSICYFCSTFVVFF